MRVAKVRPPEVRRFRHLHALEAAKLSEVYQLFVVLPAEINLGEVRPAEVRDNVGILLTPRVPGGHALLEQCDVLVVRHVTPRYRAWTEIITPARQLGRAAPRPARRSAPRSGPTASPALDSPVKRGAQA